GETGVGKSQIVRYIHQKVMPKTPLITVDCGAIPKELVESELFGYVPGAFTGANKTKKGKIELANGGALFLDEISNASLDIQAKLLRVIQEKVICKVGSIVEIPLEFTLITATNRDLLEEVKKGNFKEDLYYRIRQMEVTVPSLRENPEIIKQYVDYFVRFYNAKYVATFSVSEEYLSCMMTQPWPGNVRELDSEIQKTVFAHSIGEDYRKFIRVPQDEQGLGYRVYHQEREKILSALKKHHYRVSETAKYLNMKRTTLHSRMKKFEIGV
ncbi:MAG: sigma-54-dependent Fis family transcriptional regulator, partial [Candidatus Margulisbacteria bacterium]|nr:sigma-54-dependent Fis family transcriptional regulator [Candidatus Margulisiibacteriota bacterium]